MRAKPSSDEPLSPGMVLTLVVNAHVSPLHLSHVTVLPLFDIGLELALYSLMSGEEYELIARVWPACSYGA